MEGIKITGCLVLFNNSSAEVQELLSSVELVENLFKLYVIDNSACKRLEILCQSYPFIQYIASEKNLGFGKAHNIGLDLSQLAKANFHFIINPDIAFKTDVINILISNSREYENIGLIAPKVLNSDGSIQRLVKKIPSLLELTLSKVPIGRVSKYFKDKIELNGKYNYDKNIHAPFLSGCFLVCTEIVLNKYRFDNRYWMYFEDLDFSRTIALEHNNYIITEAAVVHGYRSEHKKKFILLRALINSYFKYFVKYGLIFDVKRRKLNRILFAQL